MIVLPVDTLNYDTKQNTTHYHFMKLPLLKLNAEGISHIILPLVVIVGVGLVGTYKIVVSHAQTQNITASQSTMTNVKGLPPSVGDMQGLESHANAPATKLPGYCYYGACFYYSGAAQSGMTASGASATFSQVTPSVGRYDAHSLIEMAAQSADGKQIVEIGETVDPGVNHDRLSHLFVYHWVNGVGTCYNGCGFVSTSKSPAVGGKLSIGATATFSIQYVSAKWIVSYNGKQLGYFPESLWHGKYVSTGLVQVFGEVAGSATRLPKSQMGNGVLGSKPKSAGISNFKLLGTKVPPRLQSYVIGGSATTYTDGYLASTGMHLGGPGY
jgi:hypothetical protein